VKILQRRSFNVFTVFTVSPVRHTEALSELVMLKEVSRMYNHRASEGSSLILYGTLLLIHYILSRVGNHVPRTDYLFNTH
jgi:hypothetical protein